MSNEPKKDRKKDVSDRSGLRDDSDRSRVSVNLTVEDKKDIAQQVSNILLPQVEKYVDTKLKEYEPVKEGAVSTVSQKAAAVAPPSVVPPSDFKDLDMNKIGEWLQRLSQKNAGQQGNPQQGMQDVAQQVQSALGGGGQGNPLMAVELLKLLMGTGNQNPMGGMMMELMYRKMMQDTAFSTDMQKIMLSGFAKRMGADSIASEFASTADVLTGQPLTKAAEIMRAGASVSQPQT